MLTVRMNWMDVERSQSVDVQLSKDSKDIPVYHRNKLYHHRAQVASAIRRQLAVIQRELNCEVDDTQTDESKAAEAITALIKGQRYRDGKTFISYIDGSSHEGTETVAAYNSFCRQRLDILLSSNNDITALVPEATEFDVSAIDKMLAEEAALASRSLAGDQEATDKKNSLQLSIDSARKDYNDRATRCSRYLSSFIAIRSAKLSEGFDPSAVESPDAPTKIVAVDTAHPIENNVAVVSEPAPIEPGIEMSTVPNSCDHVVESSEIKTTPTPEIENEEVLTAGDMASSDPVLRDATVALT